MPTGSLGAAIRYVENLTPMRSDGSLPADVELAHVSLDPLAILQAFDAMRVEVRAMDSPSLKASGASAHQARPPPHLARARALLALHHARRAKSPEDGLRSAGLLPGDHG